MSHDITRTFATLAAALALGALAAVLQPANAETDTPDPQAIAQPLPELSLRRQVMVSGNTVRLGDLFDGEVAGVAGINHDTVIAYAPQPGRRAVFDAEWLARLAYRYRLNWRPATRLDRTIVERASKIVSAEDIRFALTDELAARGYGDDYDIALSNQNLMFHVASDKSASVGIVNLSVDPAAERFNAIIAVPAGDPAAQRRTVTGRMYAMIEVPVPVSVLRPGETIGPRDIKWKSVRARNVRDTIVTDMNDLLDMEPRRALRQDNPVRRADLRTPLDVRKDGVVTMVYQTANMALSATGISLQDGTTGEIVRVRNSQTKLVVDARVTGPDSVAVQILPQLAANQGATK
ncbi:MAG: flagellar basal body P-ring formation protein FlgA [Alphaproteobacteria bacterium]|nr:flagellar basal body P-ring formation protein FlgA [Alphaproteobacteria bacterium]